MKKASLLLVLLCGFTLVISNPVYAQDSQEERALGDPEISDPLEGMNRKIFWFNDQVDVYALEPIAEAYDEVTPTPIRKGIGNFFNNLRYPVYLVSDLIQFKFTQVAKHTGRFLINTTVGVLGFIDVAEDWGLPDHEEDFGTALAYHGVPAGPYIVLPFIGPSNLRDTVGFVVDSILNPFYWLGQTTDLTSNQILAINVTQTAVKVVDQRANLLEAVKTAKESSVDYYLFLQGAYYQHRRGILYDGNVPDPEEELFDTDYDTHKEEIEKK